MRKKALDNIAILNVDEELLTFLFENRVKYTWFVYLYNLKQRYCKTSTQAKNRKSTRDLFICIIWKKGRVKRQHVQLESPYIESNKDKLEN